VVRKDGESNNSTCLFFIGVYSNKGPVQDRDEATPDKTASFRRLSDSSIDLINEDWENNEKTSMMWEIIKDADIQEFAAVLQQHPDLAHIRSEDGRGPMWWAHEYGRPKMISILRELGVREDRTDSQGVKPTDITNDRIKGTI
jgi:dolichyl-diphosphooligosaccharide--protein glycosyltransferase